MKIRPQLVAVLLTTPTVVAAFGTAGCHDSMSGFAKREWPYCQEISSDLFLYYAPMVNEDNIKIGLHAPAHKDGWSALALGGNGGMKGASQIVVRKNDDGLWVAEDRYSEKYTTPTLDASQDIKLLFADQSQDAGTSWGVLTMINSCDEEDYPIEDRSMWVQWALGSKQTFLYHGENRGQFHANFLREPKAEVKDTSDIETIDIRMPNVTVVLGAGGQDPTNPYICTFFDLEVLRKGHTKVDRGNEDSGGIHATRFSPFVNSESEKYLHHMIMYECAEDFDSEDSEDYEEYIVYEHLKVVPECQDMPQGCNELKWVWAVGSEDIIFPENVGMPFGDESRWIVIQMHYYNPNLDQGVVDSSGVTIHFTAQLRPIEAGLMQFNGGTNEEMRSPLPARQKNIVIPTFVVPEKCTKAWDEPINIIGVLHHEHLVGKRMNIEVERKGQNLGSMRLERRYDFNHQSIEEPSISRLEPGDQIVMTCEYDTTGRSDDVAFGDLSQQEMCFAAAIYYPRQKSRDIFSYWTGPGKKFMQAIISVCTNPGPSDIFSNVSSCAHIYATDVLSFFQIDSNDTVSAQDFCNHHQYESSFLPHFPNSCPPCYTSDNCTAEEVLAWGQEKICYDACTGWGLSLFPNVSVTSFSHFTICGDDETIQVIQFEHVPMDPPTCQIRGDLSIAFDPLAEPPTSGGGTAVWAMLHVCAVFATTISFLTVW